MSKIASHSMNTQNKTVAEKSRCKHFCRERVPPSWANTNGHNSNGLRTVIYVWPLSVEGGLPLKYRSCGISSKQYGAGQCQQISDVFFKQGRSFLLTKRNRTETTSERRRCFLCINWLPICLVPILLTCGPRRSIVIQFFWSARKCL